MRGDPLLADIVAVRAQQGQVTRALDLAMQMQRRASWDRDFTIQVLAKLWGEKHPDVARSFLEEIPEDRRGVSPESLLPSQDLLSSRPAVEERIRDENQGEVAAWQLVVLATELFVLDEAFSFVQEAPFHFNCGGYEARAHVAVELAKAGRAEEAFSVAARISHDQLKAGTFVLIAEELQASVPA